MQLIKHRFFGRLCGILLGLVFAIILQNSVMAAWPNNKVIISDMLDDDIRAILHLLSDAKTKNSIKAIIVSTGNTQLKAEIARTIVAQFGLNIPVYAGTSTNLRNNQVTFFAGNFDVEGRHILHDENRMILKEKYGESGNGAKKLAELIRQTLPGEKLDILCLTAPIDLVGAIKENSEVDNKKLGDLFSMGFYKRLPGGELRAPYNTMAGPESVLELLKIYQQGTFDKFYHVPSDTVQLRSNLLGGYFPNDDWGDRMRKELYIIMDENPSLQGPLMAAKEYGLSWHSTAGQQFGLGLPEESRWVPSTLKDTADASAFYLADTIPSVLSIMEGDELNAQDFNLSRVSGPIQNGLDLLKPFDFVEDASESQLRAITDLVSFDGKVALDRHLEQLRKLPIRLATNIIELASHIPQHLPSNKMFKRDRALIITFKNSPDDWFALLRLISSQEGLQSLAQGGIITEGFETVRTAKTLYSILASLGINNISIAAGHQYVEDEISNFPNFNGERAFYDLKEADKAFIELGLLKKADGFVPQSAEALLNNVFDVVEDGNKKVDFIHLGEGIDTVRYLINNPLAMSHVGTSYIMGGGRISNQGKIIFTRNWLPHKVELLSGIELIGQKTGAVYIFSTNEFGSSFVARSDEQLGNAAHAFRVLDELSDSIPVFESMVGHWENWSRVFSWVIKNEGVPFDPDKIINTLTVSSLGLYIADAWSSGFVETGKKNWFNLEYSPTEMLDQQSLIQKNNMGVFWVQQKGAPEVEPLAMRFEASIRLLADEAIKTLPQFRNSHFLSNFLRDGDVNAIRGIIQNYSEVLWLVGDVQASPDMLGVEEKDKLLSEVLFGQKHAEFDRTALAILNIKWVLAGDYESFTGQQKSSRMTRESFQQLQAHAQGLLNDSEKLDAMLVYMTIHDLGKSAAFIEQAKKIGITSIDHDVILTELLNKRPDLIPSFERLSSKYKKMILDGLNANFNMGQFIQGENVAASLQGLKSLGKDSLDFYMFHVLMDIAGVTGHVNTKGSIVMNEPTYFNFRTAISSLEGLANGKNFEEVYDDYLLKQAHKFNLDSRLDERTKAVVRIGLMLRLEKADDINNVLTAIDSLDSTSRELLINELNNTGMKGSPATLIYYSPAFLSNVTTAAKKQDPVNGFQKGLRDGLQVLVQVFTESRRQHPGDGVFSVNIRDLAEQAKTGDLSQILERGVDVSSQNGNEAIATIRKLVPVQIISTDCMDLFKKFVQ